MRTKVFVGVPMEHSVLRGELHHFLLGLVFKSFLDPECPYWFQFPAPVRETRPVEFARNTIVDAFLDSECDVLWFLDADNIPHEGAENVLRGNYDVSIGPVPMLIVAGSGHPVVWPNLFSGIDGSNVGTMWNPGDPVKAGGTANMAIKRKVLEDERLWTDGQESAVFRRGYDAMGKPLFGEDCDFCRRALDAGYTVGAELDAVCDHAKTYGLDFYMRVLLGMIERGERKVGPEPVGQVI